jgi:hypothetical protein
MFTLRFVRYAPPAMLVALGLFASPTEATTIYDFNDFGNHFAASTTTANATSSDFQIDSSRGWGCGTSCAGYGDFSAQFSVAANAGYALAVTGFSFDEWNSSQFGPTRFDVFTSVDGFSSPILSALLSPNATTFTNHTVSLALSGLTDPLTVRIVASGHDNNAGAVSAWNLDNVTLTATAVPLAAPVPEPTSMILLGTGLLGVAGCIRRGPLSARVSES